MLTAVVLIAVGAYFVSAVLYSDTPPATETPQTQDTVHVTTGLNKSAGVPTVKIIPIELLEDSRCPIDVQCIQAGTVKVRVQLATEMGTSTNIYTLGSAVTTDIETVTLIEVLPAPRSQIQIEPSQYQFIFEIKPHNI